MEKMGFFLLSEDVLNSLQEFRRLKEQLNRETKKEDKNNKVQTNTKFDAYGTLSRVQMPNAIENKDQTKITNTDAKTRKVQLLCNLINQYKTRNREKQDVVDIQHKIIDIVDQMAIDILNESNPQMRQFIEMDRLVYVLSIVNGNADEKKSWAEKVRLQVDTFGEQYLTREHRRFLNLITSDEFLKAIEPYEPKPTTEETKTDRKEKRKKNNIANEITDAWYDGGDISEIKHKIEEAKKEPEYKDKQEKIETLLESLDTLQKERERVLKKIEGAIENWNIQNPKPKTDVASEQDEEELRASILDDLGVG